MSESTVEKGIKLSCGCLEKNKKELHKSIINYYNDVSGKSMLNVGAGSGASGKNNIFNNIAYKLESVFKSKEYDYKMMVQGFYNILLGIGSLIFLDIIGAYTIEKLERYSNNSTRTFDAGLDFFFG